MIRYPAGPITPHGAYHLLKGTHPTLSLSAYDDSVLIHLMGGLAVPDRTEPECVQLKRGGLKGLVPPWQTIDHKGATQDGATFVTALYDPIEVDLNVVVRGRDAKHCRRVIKHLIASIDAKKESELAFTTLEGGRWWAPIRWSKAPPNNYEGAQSRRQELTLRLRADNGFWRTYDDVDSFTSASGTGFLKRVNVGDQPMRDRYTCFGPGTFKFANGPGSTDFIEFGPLLPNQIVQIRTDNGKMTVVDLTSTPATPQQLTQFQKILKEFLDFASGGNTPPLFAAIESVFGIVPPQGNLYSLLKGRFGETASIPPKSPGAQAQPYFVKVIISGGTTDTKVIVAGTPQRRYPA